MFNNIKSLIAISVKQFRARMDVAENAGAVTMNQPAGKIMVAAGASSVVLTNSYIFADSIVFVQVTDADAGNRYVLSAVPAAGSCTITMSGAVTADQELGFFVVQKAA